MPLTVTGGVQRQQTSDETPNLCLRRDMSQRTSLPTVKFHTETTALTDRLRVLYEHRKTDTLKHSELAKLRAQGRHQWQSEKHLLHTCEDFQNP